MEAETLNANHLPYFLHQTLHSVVPMLMISIGYIDPGKWAATVEGGARFGFDLTAFMLVFSFAAILCQYLSARIGVVTGKDLAEICRDEYDAWTCLFLGVQAELSVILLDLNMILGMAHVLNLIFGWDLFTGVFLAATTAVFHLLLAILLDNGKAKILGLFVAGFVLLFFTLGVLINQHEIPVAMSGILTKLSGESSFVLMSLLGATLVPHNFYLHSSIVQTWGKKNVLCVLLRIDAVVDLGCLANEFYGTGLVLVTFQDALSPMDQVLRSPIALLGAEGMYQLLIFTQVVIALQLPSSLIPLFRIATSISIMGVHKISHSDWVSYLRWNVGNGMSATYSVLLIIAFVSLALMLWLVFTPLKSASVPLDAQAWNCGLPEAIPHRPIESEESNLTETSYHINASLKVKEPSSTLARALEISDVSVANFHPDLPETLMEPDQELHVTTDVENRSITPLPIPPMYLAKESVSTLKSESVSTVENEISDARDTKTGEFETSAPVERTVEVETATNAERDDDDDGDSWETEESSKVVSASAQSSTLDGPASFRSLSGKSDDGGNSIGSLSRLAGLGRAARRQLATILDEFWKQLYDYHGQATQDAKAKKLDVLLGVDLRFSGSLQNVNAFGKDYSEYLASVGSRASDTLMNSGLYDSPKQPRMQSNFESSYNLQRSSSSLRTNPIQLLDAYVQNSSHNLLDSSERRYSSVRNLPSSEVWYSQPATVHGSQVASYPSQVGKDRIPDHLNGQGELLSLKSPSIANTNYRDSLAFALGQKLQNGVGVTQPPGFQNIAISRNSTLQSERSCNDYYFFGPVDNVGSSVNTKKYHSLPDISGYAIPPGNVYASNKNAPFDGSIGYGCVRTCYEPTYSNSGSRTGAPLAFDEPSKVYRDALSSQLSSGFGTGSLWSRQPFEQFGVPDKIHNVAMEGVGSRPSSISQETTSVVDIEMKLLQSFRHCILKLLKLEGSDWLFRQNGGVDEDLIDRVAAREKFLCEVEARETNSSSFSVSSVPHCGEGCIWKSDVIVSFGVWCIRRVLELSLMESRPELWGKYTYVLNLLQGVIDPAFSKPRTVMAPCFCLQVPTAYQQKSSPPLSNGMLPPPPAAKPGRGKCTTSSMMLDLIKDVEIAISNRKGRTGTAAGEVAFPKGKENLASVLKRYKRRLSNKSSTTQEGSGSRKISSSYNS
ncbi:ethylene-insensitive protein 2-like [Senna tora]|uniref:Ethylene-insensitive protein 2-like n=1 Tax=Senna tora TaxID=362788 RepID=A0A834TCI1_9FABA|nr:ethylene-insensitive protein 2-like [Senna tora]